jgi:hypothetical protein
MTRRDELKGGIETGMVVRPLLPGDLDLLQSLAAAYIDEGQIVKAQIALTEAAAVPRVSRDAADRMGRAIG